MIVTRIRHATADDVPTIAALGEQFHAEAGWADIVSYEPADCAKTLAYLVENENGILFVAEEAGELIGMAGGLAHPFYFNLSHKTGSELFWWIKPGARNGVGKLLLDRLEDEARAIGCVSWAMVAVDRVKPELMGRLYRMRGYRASEHSYIKRLTQ